MNRRVFFAAVAFLLLLTAPALAPAQAQTGTPVPENWGLVPDGLSGGDEFRLLFVTSTPMDSKSADIEDYNKFVQGRAAAGHGEIQAYSSGFRVVGSTETVDARDNTATTYTKGDKGVRIYWLGGGTKVADDYEDFYDGSWDDEANRKTESGKLNSKPSVLTGSNHDGTAVRSTKLKPRWDVHLSGDDDQLGCAGESLSSVLGG